MKLEDILSIKNLLSSSDSLFPYTLPDKYGDSLGQILEEYDKEERILDMSLGDPHALDDLTGDETCLIKTNRSINYSKNSKILKEAGYRSYSATNILKADSPYNLFDYNSFDLIISENPLSSKEDGSKTLLGLENLLKPQGDLIVASDNLLESTTEDYLHQTGLEKQKQNFNDLERYGSFLRLKNYINISNQGKNFEERIKYLLERNGGNLRQSDIVKNVDVSSATVSRRLSEMEECGQISRKTLGRSKIVRLSEE